MTQRQVLGQEPPIAPCRSPPRDSMASRCSHPCTLASPAAAAQTRTQCERAAAQTQQATPRVRRTVRLYRMTIQRPVGMKTSWGQHHGNSVMGGTQRYSGVRNRCCDRTARRGLRMATLLMPVAVPLVASTAVDATARSGAACVTEAAAADGVWERWPFSASTGCASCKQHKTARQRLPAPAADHHAHLRAHIGWARCPRPSDQSRLEQWRVCSLCARACRPMQRYRPLGSGRLRRGARRGAPPSPCRQHATCAANQHAAHARRSARRRREGSCARNGAVVCDGWSGRLGGSAWRGSALGALSPPGVPSSVARGMSVPVTPRASGPSGASSTPPGRIEADTRTRSREHAHARARACAHRGEHRGGRAHTGAPVPKACELPVDRRRHRDAGGARGGGRMRQDATRGSLDEERPKVGGEVTEVWHVAFAGVPATRLVQRVQERREALRQHATCNVQQTTCNRQTCNRQHATCNRQTCNMQQTNMQRTGRRVHPQANPSAEKQRGRGEREIRRNGTRQGGRHGPRRVQRAGGAALSAARHLHAAERGHGSGGFREHARPRESDRASRSNSASDVKQASKRASERANSQVRANLARG
jgi:hypothetical protein